MRCLTLADALRVQGARVSFVSRPLAGNLGYLAELKGYKVHALPAASNGYVRVLGDSRHAEWLGIDWKTDADDTKRVLKDSANPVDWLIVDHYALDCRWERELRALVGGIMVIDDIADRAHDCDMILDQNLHIDQELRYRGLVPVACRQFLGPLYALLRPEFVAERRHLRKRDGSVRRLLIFLGGSDPANETLKALDAVVLLDGAEISIDVVVGAANMHRALIAERCASMKNTSFHCQVDHMAGLMAEADLSIGAGGSTTWERSCLGLPSIVMSLASNQVDLSTCAAKAGIQVYLGQSQDISAETIAAEIDRLIPDRTALRSMSQRAMRLVDGEGARRIVERMTSHQ
jgi:UDP-2,4-diacetamido-2,4,6-trideoxy-beta-L-altropyranose hydrolase